MKLFPFLVAIILISCGSGHKPMHLKHAKPGNLQFFETYSFSEIFPSWENACKWVHEHDSLATEQNLDLTENPRGLNALVRLNGNYMVGYVYEENMYPVAEMLANPEVKKAFPANLQFRWSYGVEEENGHKMVALYAIKMPSGNEAKIDGRHIQSANAVQSYTGQPVIRIVMNQQGSQAWKTMTSDNIGKAIAIVIDDHVLTCPVVNGAITGGETEISGNFTKAEAEELAARIYAGVK